MEIRAGTSGFAYKEWKGSFYPEKTRPADMLGLYAARLPAVEINNTFYRMPKREVVEGWAASVPEGFRFAVKASQRITHRKRLADAEEETDFLLGQLAPLGEKLGAVLLQLPPYLRANRERLERFLDHWAGRAPLAVEFRHGSWNEPAVHEALRARGAALVAAETDDETGELTETAPFGYLRLRRTDYTTPELAGWLARLRATAWREAFVFFKHEDAAAGPAFAEELLALAARGRARAVRGRGAGAGAREAG